MFVFIQFLFLMILTDLVDNIPDLLELAHRYEITYIKSVCAQKLATMKRKKFPLKKKLALAYKYELDPLKV